MFTLIMAGALVLFGMLTLILTMGYKNIETERGQAQEMLEVSEPLFFGLDESTRVSVKLSDRGVNTSDDLESLVHQVDQYLRREKKLAERFSDKPTVANLHRRTESAPWSN